MSRKIDSNGSSPDHLCLHMNSQRYESIMWVCVFPTANDSCCVWVRQPVRLLRHRSSLTLKLKVIRWPAAQSFSLGKIRFPCKNPTALGLSRLLFEEIRQLLFDMIDMSERWNVNAIRYQVMPMDRSCSFDISFCCLFTIFSLWCLTVASLL